MIRYVPDLSVEDKPESQTSHWLQAVGGSELNVAVSLTRLGWREPQWVSVLPHGPLGDHLLKRATEAMKSSTGFRLLRREEGEVGIYHVWPAEHKLFFQRRHSTFALMDPEWFAEGFWRKELELAPSRPALRFLHVSGISPLISSQAATAWGYALKAAAALRAAGESGRGLAVTMDLNLRPALGTLQQLWALTEPHLGTLDLLVLSLGVLSALAGIGGASIPNDALAEGRGEEAPEQFDAAVGTALKNIQASLQKAGHSPPPLLVCCKRRDSKRPKHSDGVAALPLQRRWSVVCVPAAAGEAQIVSTFSKAVQHSPREELGGGDAYLSGVIDGLALAFETQKEEHQKDSRPRWLPDEWAQALQRGDRLAALAQEELGDFSTVERPQLEAGLQAD